MVSSGSGILPEYRGVTGTPRGKYWAYMGLSGESGEPARGGRAPLIGVRIGLGEGAVPPFPSPSPSPSFSPPVRKEKGGPNPTRGGVLVGLPPWRAPPGRPPPPPLLHIWGQGAPHSTSIVLLAVCGAPLHSLLLRL